MDYNPISPCCLCLCTDTNNIDITVLAFREVTSSMGKRKSRAKPPPKKRMDKLDTVFSCPFCNHGTSVECRIDMKNLIGEASCRICQENFSTTVTGRISVYSEWIDECERVNTVDDDGVPVEDDVD
ncbi:hypothetical protein E3N88_19092 [Mikania micrantha]|uniref:Transcription elongation factor 1 homolog n=1 Tax=Mikania micrantha TaxID=192012 RepID=A0A5N6NM69_9ASTR|nr:hypothetical protein E3N88_19092 [Mikania micrantha]